MTQILLELVISSLLLGCWYILFAAGLNLIFGVTRVVNFAHGEFIMLGGYAGFWFWSIFKLDPIFMALIIFPISLIAGFGLCKLLIKPLLKGPSAELNTLIMTFGLSILISNLARSIWTTAPRATSAPAWFIFPFGISISVTRLVISLISLFIVVILYIFLKKSFTGKAVRAVSQNREAALAIGLDVDHLTALSLGIGIALASLAGTLVSSTYAVHPYIGLPFALISFSIIIFGGMGSFKGLFIGAFVLATIENFSAYLVGVMWKEFIFFVIILIMVSIRPSGIAKTEVRVG